jgi:hypothetical protein
MNVVGRTFVIFFARLNYFFVLRSTKNVDECIFSARYRARSVLQFVGAEFSRRQHQRLDDMLEDLAVTQLSFQLERQASTLIVLSTDAFLSLASLAPVSTLYSNSQSFSTSNSFVWGFAIVTTFLHSFYGIAKLRITWDVHIVKLSNYVDTEYSV